jgi:guanylate kinase
MANKGKIFIITGPSGAGKTEVAKRILLNKSLKIQRVITCTTRGIRPGEVDGKDYFFLTKEEFLKNIKNDAMFEYAEVYGNYYGSRKKDVESILESGKNILFTVDVKGALNLKKIDPGCKVIFIRAESPEELKRRLTDRKTDSQEVIDNRVREALAELKLENKFDYNVINFNGKLDKTIIEVEKIIKKAGLS